MVTPKLIILNGFAGCGKTTLANKYLENHPMALNLEGDRLIGMIGQWKTNYEPARSTIFPLTKALAKQYLELGYDVIVPYLLTDAKHAEEFRKIADETNSLYFEIYLYTEKNVAIERLMKRGTWGEADLPPLTEKDLPEIDKLYHSMEKATALRPDVIKIKVIYGDIEATYNDLLTKIQQTLP